MKNIAFAISGILLTGAVAVATLPSTGYSASDDSTGTSSSSNYNNNSSRMKCPTGQTYDSNTGACASTSSGTSGSSNY